jgi:DNA repair protein RadD
VTITLRPYQTRDVERLRAAYRSGHRAPLYVLPTGGGKTYTFAYITSQAAARGNRVLILVHRQELLLQSSESLDSIGVDHGLIAPGHTMTTDPVQVASVQTLVRRLDRITPPDLIVIDESHHSGAETWGKILRAFPEARLLGVTATPCRLDGAGLGTVAGGFFDCMVQGPTIMDLIEEGYLSRPKVYAPPTGVDLSGVHTRMGDYVKSEMAAAIDKPKITGSAVEHYRRLCAGVPAIAFCASVAHAEHVAEEFRTAGFRAASIDGGMADGERKGRIRDLGSGGLQILTSCDIISEGTDIPVVGAALLLRPTQSLGLFLQQVGRALRPYPGKQHAVILDHVGNCLRHGLPDEEREWSLEGHKGSRASAKSQDVNVRTRQCERCYGVHRPAPRCPFCGHEYDDAPLPEQVDGELREIDEEQAEFLRRAKRREVGKAVAMANSLAELQALAKEFGYAPGWAWHRWQMKRGRQQAAGR